jgi:hypothetical protein
MIFFFHFLRFFHYFFTDICAILSLRNKETPRADNTHGTLTHLQRKDIKRKDIKTEKT